MFYFWPLLLVRLFILCLVSAVREVYKPTVCKDDWVGWKGFCYQLHKGTESPLSQLEANLMCKTIDAELASINSIEDVEMLHVNFHKGTQISPALPALRILKHVLKSLIIFILITRKILMYL